MSHERREERDGLARALRQTLESLRRSGLDRVPSARTVVSVVPVVSATPPRLEEPGKTPAKPLQEVERQPPPRPVRPAALPVKPLFKDVASANPAVPVEERAERLADLAREVASCIQCPLLASTRTQTVFGAGSPTARLMFIGEAPGADEDRTGAPFVGRAGQLLTDMITKGMGLTRDEVYIANVLKSRPPENRAPLPDEIAHCLPFLERQIDIIRPDFLCLLGKTAAGALLETALSIGRLRGRWHRCRGVPTIVTYHPSYLLRTPSGKKEAWEDLQILMKAMGITPPARKKI